MNNQLRYEHVIYLSFSPYCIMRCISHIVGYLTTTNNTSGIQTKTITIFYSINTTSLLSLDKNMKIPLVYYIFHPPKHSVNGYLFH